MALIEVDYCVKSAGQQLKNRHISTQVIFPKLPAFTLVSEYARKKNPGLLRFVITLFLIQGSFLLSTKESRRKEYVSWLP
jgi:hypothetical protein